MKKYIIKWKILIKAIFISISFIFVLSTSGCMMTLDRASKAAKKYLEKKYQEEFVIESVKGGFGSSNPEWKSYIAYPLNNPEMKFTGHVKKGYKEFSDCYMDRIMEKKVNEYLQSLVSTYFGIGTVINAMNSVRIPALDTKDKDMTIEEYFMHPDATSVGGHVILPYDNSTSFNEIDMSGQILAFGMNLEGIGQMDTALSFIFIEEIKFEEIVKAAEEIEHTRTRSQLLRGSALAATILQVKKGKLISTQEEIIESFHQFEVEKIKAYSDFNMEP